MNNTFIKVEEVAEILGISKSYAYKIVRQLNNELKEKRVPDDFGQSEQNLFYGAGLHSTCGKEGLNGSL